MFSLENINIFTVKRPVVRETLQWGFARSASVWAGNLTDGGLAMKRAFSLLLALVLSVSLCVPTLVTTAEAAGHACGLPVGIDWKPLAIVDGTISTSESGYQGAADGKWYLKLVDDIECDDDWLNMQADTVIWLNGHKLYNTSEAIGIYNHSEGFDRFSDTASNSDLAYDLTICNCGDDDDEGGIDGWFSVFGGKCLTIYGGTFLHKPKADEENDSLIRVENGAADIRGGHFIACKAPSERMMQGIIPAAIAAVTSDAKIYLSGEPTFELRKSDNTSYDPGEPPEFSVLSAPKDEFGHSGAIYLHSKADESCKYTGDDKISVYTRRHFDGATIIYGVSEEQAADEMFVPSDGGTELEYLKDERALKINALNYLVKVQAVYQYETKIGGRDVTLTGPLPGYEEEKTTIKQFILNKTASGVEPISVNDWADLNKEWKIKLENAHPEKREILGWSANPGELKNVGDGPYTPSEPESALMPIWGKPGTGGDPDDTGRHRYTPEDPTVNGPKTFDGGIAVYAAAGLLSAAGSAAVVSRRKRAK